jgi:hypothetical protein
MYPAGFERGDVRACSSFMAGQTSVSSATSRPCRQRMPDSTGDRPATTVTLAVADCAPRWVAGARAMPGRVATEIELEVGKVGDDCGWGSAQGLGPADG